VTYFRHLNNLKSLRICKKGEGWQQDLLHLAQAKKTDGHPRRRLCKKRYLFSGSWQVA